MLPSGGCGRSNVLVNSVETYSSGDHYQRNASEPVPVGAGFRLVRTPKRSANCSRRLARPRAGLPKTHTKRGPLLLSHECPSPCDTQHNMAARVVKSSRDC